MKTTSLGTLEKAGLPAGQSRAILEVMESEWATTHDMLATKADLLVLKSELKAEISELRSELRSEFKSGIKGLETKLVLWMFGMSVVLGTFLYTTLSHGRP